jgi:hypothetical protein
MNNLENLDYINEVELPFSTWTPPDCLPSEPLPLGGNLLWRLNLEVKNLSMAKFEQRKVLNDLNICRR